MPIAQKIHRLERAQYAFLDHSKTLVFSDVIKIEILARSRPALPPPSDFFPKRSRLIILCIYINCNAFHRPHQRKGGKKKSEKRPQKR